MNILIVVEKKTSAIDILSEKIKQYNPHFNIFILAVHPKRPSSNQLRLFQKKYQWADIIHWQYWKTAEMLRDKYSWASDKPSLLTHHNPYDIDKKNWAREYTDVVVKNNYQKEKLPYATQIPHTVDLNEFEYKEEMPEARTVGMVAGRIESSKGILEAVKATKKTNAKFILVGRISDRNYFKEIQKEAGEKLDFREDVSFSELIQAYHHMQILIVNSKDNFESGPLPILEAFATGTPVITRRVGFVPDIENGENMIVRDGEQKDIDELAEHIEFLLEHKHQRENLRRAGFYTVKNRPSEVSATLYSKAYYSIYSEKPLVSIIVPTFNRADTLNGVLLSIEAQDWENKEIIVCDDNSKDNTQEVVLKARQNFKTPIKYINTYYSGYGLARARNMGATEAQGEYLLFLDDRLLMKSGAITSMIEKLRENARTWVWGIKDDLPKDFVENFSAIRRNEFIRAGMFNERIEWYGGMSQEIRERFGRQGFKFKRTKAHAKSFVKSRRWYNRKKDIVKAKLLLFKLYG